MTADPSARRDRISAISAITVSPRAHRLNLHFQLLPDNENAHGEDVVEYLRQLRAALRWLEWCAPGWLKLSKVLQHGPPWHFQ